jgi:hypothetical protein
MIMATYIRISFEGEVMFMLLYYKSIEICHKHIFFPGEPTNIIQRGQVIKYIWISYLPVPYLKLWRLQYNL